MGPVLMLGVTSVYRPITRSGGRKHSIPCNVPAMQRTL